MNEMRNDYEKNPSTFYSWTGAVNKDARGQGVGSALMKKQHEWCRENTDERGEPKIMLEKKL